MTHPNSSHLPANLSKIMQTMWKFSRPHTIIGSGISIVTLFMYAVSPELWTSRAFVSSIIESGNYYLMKYSCRIGRF